MCSPVAAAVIAPAIIQSGAEILGAVEQQKKYEENKRLAEKSALNNMRLIGMRQMQEQRGGAQTLFQQDMEARRADAQSRVMAGESGVAGASVDILLADIERQKLNAQAGVEENTKATMAQEEEAKKAVSAQKRSQIASVPAPNPWATALKIGGHGAGAAGEYIKLQPKKGGS